MGAVLYRLRCRLRSRWPSAAALALVVAVLGGVVLALVAGTVRTLTASDRYSDARGAPFDARLQQDGPPRTAEVAALPAVAHIEAATFVFGAIVPEGTPLELAGGEGPDVSVFAGSLAALGTTVVDGREADPARPDEFMVTRSLAQTIGARLGDRFDLYVVPSGPAQQRGFDAFADSSVKLLTGTLVGTTDGPAHLESGIESALFPASLLTVGDVGTALTISNVSLAPGADIDELRQELDGLPEGSDFAIDAADWVPGVVRDAVRTQGIGLGVLTAIAGVATVVVVGQLLGRQVRLSEVERLILGSMGMGPRQIASHPLLAAAVPTVVGAAAAVVAASFASDIFPTGFASHVEPHPGLRFDALSLLAGAAVLVVLVLAWVLVANVLSNRPHAAARRPAMVDAIARRSPAQPATALRLAFVRQSRDSSSPRPAVVGLVAVACLLVGALTFGSSLGELIDRPPRWGYAFDLGIGQGGGGEVPSEALSVITGDPDVRTVVLLADVTTTVGNDRFEVAAEQSVEGSVATHYFRGRDPQGADEIAIGRVAARRFGVDVGDDLVVVGADGPHTMRITGVGVMPGVEGGEGVGEGGLVTFDGARQLDPSVAPTAVAMLLRPGASIRVVRDRLEGALGVGVGQTSRPAVIVNLARVRSIPYVIGAILAVLALVDLGHQLIVSTQRRRRDVAVLRALGADRRWVTGVVHWQASLVTLLVTALAIPLGIVVGRVVYHAFIDRIGALDTVSVPIALLALGATGLLVLANVIAAPNAARVRHEPPSVVLADE